MTEDFQNHFHQSVGRDGVGIQASHANITFYGARVPTVEPLPAPAAPDPAWLMKQPSRLLDARSQVVPFVGREPELERLRQWRDAREARLSVLLLHAPGGQGKTRLAMEFAERSRNPELSGAEPWQVLQAGFQGTSLGSSSLSVHGMHMHGAMPDDAAGVLLVVDYADRWAHSELARLLSDPVLNQQRPTRVLLIGRTVRWFAALRGELGERRADADDLPLPSIAADRLRMFAAARDRYGSTGLYGLTDTASIQPAGSLDHRDYGLTLNLHMAALVAVDAHAHGKKPSLTEPHELSAYLLDRERLAWQRLYDAGRHGQDYRTRPTVMARTVFTAVLTGAVDQLTGEHALETLKLSEHPQDLIDDHRTCYQPADDDMVLEPLYPDRLAEDFLGLLTPGHRISAYEADPWAKRVPARLTAAEELRPVIAPRAVTFLASAAARWPHLGEGILYPLLREHPTLAVEAGSDALSAVAALRAAGSPDGPLDPELLAVLEAIEPHLPTGSHIDLDIGTLAVAEALISHRLATTTDRVEHARLHGTLANRLANAGRHEQALAAGEEAVRRYRELADVNSFHLVNLATMLSNLSNRLSNLGRWEDALAPSEEAVTICRKLAGADPDSDAGRPGLAFALTNLGNRLRDLGRPEDALLALQEAASIRRALADEDPASYRSDLAGTLSNLGLMLDDLDRPEEAVAATEEAAQVYRQLAKADPATQLPHLAMSLTNLGRSLIGLKLPLEALTVTAEAAQVYRRLAQTNPAVYQPALATLLTNVSSILEKLDRKEEALAPAEEAVSIQRQLVESNPGARLPDLVRVLNNLAIRLSGLGRWAAALRASEEAVAIQRGLAATNFVAHAPDLTNSLRILRGHLSGLRRHEEALTIAEEAVAIQRRLAATSEQRSALAESLADLGKSFAGLGRMAECKAALQQAATTYQENDRPAEAAEVLSQYGSILVQSGQFEDAVDICERAADIYRGIGDRYLEAMELANLSHALGKVGREDASITAAERAAALYREIGDPYLEAAALVNLSHGLLGATRFTEAISACRRATELFRGSGHGQRLGPPLYNLGRAFYAQGRHEEAIAASEESAAVYRETENRPCEADALALLGRSRYADDQLEKAATACQHAADIYWETGNPRGEADALSVLGDALLALGRLEDAIAASERAAALYREL
ncbi:tetratricopeptide repeat protein [Streptomyces sp. NPDC050619]|uniref:tetratricopeptide repeat protein n=1 Tax=Streptomyces sp. NPDC050619 TaxID=3157214 RepID=UPI003442FA5A